MQTLQLYGTEEKLQKANEQLFAFLAASDGPLEMTEVLTNYVCNLSASIVSTNVCLF